MKTIEASNPETSTMEETFRLLGARFDQISRHARHADDRVRKIAERMAEHVERDLKRISVHLSAARAQITDLGRDTDLETQINASLQELRSELETAEEFR